ncbi:MAG: sigma-70 family RNA polymerase sigma factor [Anaerolineae bacterium]|nr:sigma-70 family RNA polymerase sigma factor [Anaerolineae bacterium]
MIEDYSNVVSGAINGDGETRRAGFDELVRRFRGMAFKQAYQMLGDVQMAEDAVQEAFLTAYLHIEKLRDPQAFPAWLRRIVMTQSHRMIRGKQPHLETLETRLDLATEKPSPESILEEREMQSHLQSAIDALPEKERAVTEGFYIQGESQKEIAERLQVPLTTVKKRLQYAREHLRLLVGDVNAAFDHAIASVLKKQPKPQPQPVYVYTRKQTADDDTTT